MSNACVALPASTAVTAEAPRTLYVETQGATLAVEGERLVVRAPGGGTPVGHVGLPKLGRVILFGTVHMTGDAAKRLLRAGVPVFLLSQTGNYYGRLASTAHTSAEAVRAQCAAVADPERRLTIARALVYAKLSASELLLRQRSHKLPADEARTALRGALQRIHRLGRDAGQAPSLESLRGIEGAAARLHFDALAQLFPDGTLAFAGRSRRPPEDPANALLSFTYTLGHGLVHALAEVHHLHPYVGLYHEDRAGHPALASDLLEPVRPSLDGLVLHLARRRRFARGDFEWRGGGCFLKAPARRRLVEAFEAHVRRPRQRMGGRSLWQHLAAQAASLSAHLRDPGTPFVLPPFL